MAITDNDEAEVVQLLCDDVAATLGPGHEAAIRGHAASVRELRNERSEYFAKVVEDVQQDFHDLFIDTAWPPCPLHRRHPLWYHDGFWVCEQVGTRIASLGHLRDGLVSALMSERKDILYQCCFCAQSIEDTAPRFLVLAIEDGGSQKLPCHESCLRRVIHPSVPLAI